jgi:hypothetical protein
MKSKIFFLLFFSGLFSFAQKNQVTYTVINNNTEPTFVNGRVGPWDVLISGSRFTFAGNGGLRFYSKGIYVNAGYDFHYIDNLAETQTESRVDGESVYKSQKSRSGEIMAGYLIGKEKNGPIRFNLKSAGKIMYYTMVQVDYRQYFGVEAGLRTGFSHLTYKKEGLSGKNYYAPSSGEVVMASAFTTYMQYTWLQFGGSFGKIIDAELDFSGIGLRKARYMTKYYAYAILPVKKSLEDIYYTKDYGSSSQLVYRYVLDGVVPMSSFGFRAGYEYIPSASGMGAAIEIGSMPGIKAQGAGNFYFNIRWNFTFGKSF